MSDYLCNCDSNLPIWADDSGLITAKDLLPMTQVFYGPLLYDIENANFTIGRLRCTGMLLLSFHLSSLSVIVQIQFLGNSAQNEIASQSCATMKKAGHFKNDIYSLKSPNENWPRLSQCNMSGADGYEDNDSMESLIGYINHSPKPVQPQEYVFSAIANSGTISSGNYVTFEKFLVANGNAFDLSTGTFTAPTSGTYDFSFSGNTPDDDRCGMKVFKNEEIVHSVYTRGGSGNHEPTANLASSWTIFLKVGDKMTLKVVYGALYSWPDSGRILTGKLLEIS